jgi:hypothetical protein
MIDFAVYTYAPFIRYYGETLRLPYHSEAPIHSACAKPTSDIMASSPSFSCDVGVIKVVRFIERCPFVFVPTELRDEHFQVH